MLEQLVRELLDVCEMVKQVEAEVSKADWDIQCPKAELEKRVAQRDNLQAQLDRLHREGTSLRKRHEIASQVLAKGYDPSFVLELNQEGLTELERRLDQLELEETKKKRRPRNLDWFISQLVRNPGREKVREWRLLCHGLAKDPLRLRKVSLEKELNELTIGLKQTEIQMQTVMGYEDSEDQIARLKDSKARIEKKLSKTQEELVRLNREICGCQPCSHYK